MNKTCPAMMLLLAGLSLGGAPARAQPAAPPARAELSPAERAQRDADKVFHWIRLSADKPATRPVAPPAKPVAAPPRSAPAMARAASRADAEPVASATPPPTLLAAAASAQAVDAPQSLPPAPVAAAPEPAAEPVQELPLTVLSRVEPQIPRQLLGSLRQGTVLVRLLVQPDGSVGRAEVVQSSHKRLGQAAIDAVLQWRFAPISAPRQASVELGFQIE